MNNGHDNDNHIQNEENEEKKTFIKEDEIEVSKEKQQVLDEVNKDLKVEKVEEEVDMQNVKLYNGREIEEQNDSNSDEKIISKQKRHGSKNKIEIINEEQNVTTMREQRKSNESLQLLPQLPSMEKMYSSKSSSTISSVFNQNNSQERNESIKSLDGNSLTHEINNQNSKLTLPKLSSSKLNFSNDYERDDMSALTDGNSYRTIGDSTKEESSRSNQHQTNSHKSPKKKKL